AKPLPETMACETLRLALPGLLTVRVWVLAVPMGTLPKFTFPGTTEICAEEGVTPSALSAIILGELGELLTKERAPFTPPTLVGAKLTVNAAELPGSTVSGRVRPFKAKPPPE